MATTPNFGWVTPAPTDFVTDLPADFETFADAVDADVQLIKNTADAALPETIIDAAGDLIYGSAADTAARLAIGTAGQVLTVNSGATAPEWADAAGGGNETLISTTSMSGSSTINLTSIPGTYTHLRILLKDVDVSADTQIKMGLNQAASNHYSNIFTSISASGSIQQNVNISLFEGADMDPAGNDSTFQIWIYNYAATDLLKTLNWVGMFYENINSRYESCFGAGGYNSASAITSIRFLVTGGATFTGGSILLYGVN